MLTWIWVFLLCSWKNKNIILKIRRSKVTDYAALRLCNIFHVQPSIKFILLLNNCWHILKTFMSRKKYNIWEFWSKKCRYFSAFYFYVQMKYHGQLRWARKKFYFMLSSEFNAYRMWIKRIFSAVKWYRSVWYMYFLYRFTAAETRILWRGIFKTGFMWMAFVRSNATHVGTLFSSKMTSTFSLV